MRSWRVLSVSHYPKDVSHAVELAETTELGVKPSGTPSWKSNTTCGNPGKGQQQINEVGIGEVDPVDKVTQGDAMEEMYSSQVEGETGILEEEKAKISGTLWIV